MGQKNIVMLSQNRFNDTMCVQHCVKSNIKLTLINGKPNPENIVFQTKIISLSKIDNLAAFYKFHFSYVRRRRI